MSHGSAQRYEMGYGAQGGAERRSRRMQGERGGESAPERSHLLLGLLSACSSAMEVMVPAGEKGRGQWHGMRHAKCAAHACAQLGLARDAGCCCACRRGRAYRRRGSHSSPSQRWALVNRFTDAIWASARFCLGFCLLFFLVEMRFTSG